MTDNNTLSNEQLDAFLDANERLLEAHVKAGGKPEDLQLRLIHRKRHNDAAAAKAAQPALGIARGAGSLQALVEEFRKPVTEAERAEANGGMDQLLISFHEFLDAGDLEDAIHAAFRVARKAHIGVFNAQALDIDPSRWSPIARKAYGLK